MPGYTAIVKLSLSAAAAFDVKEVNPDSRYSWVNTFYFIYFAFSYSASILNFDVFGEVIHADVNIYDFILLELTVGMTYMCMDVFIRQYRRKIDFAQSLNPLLKGITIGLLMQTVMWILLNAIDLADTLRFFASSLNVTPSWTKCHSQNLANKTCVTSRDILIRCREQNITLFNKTSAHWNYMRSFSNTDKGVITTKSFLMALVWVCNFLFATVNNKTLLKFFKLSFIIRTLSTIVVGVIILFSDKLYAFNALGNIFNLKSLKYTYSSTMDCVIVGFGIGSVGVFDFGTMSRYTLIDNAVLVYTVFYTVITLIRSFIIRVLYLILTTCVEVELVDISAHYVMFALLPLSTEFLYAQRLYVLYIYANNMVALYSYLVLVTLTTSKLLHSEFTSIKNLYIVGILCFLGFGFSVPLAVSQSRPQLVAGLVYGLQITGLYLAGLKLMVVMWVYGVENFCNDIDFWLGFKPTKFWSYCWRIGPVILFYFFARKLYELTQISINVRSLTAIVWFVITVLFVAVINIRTTEKYMINNNLIGVFKSSNNDGPPDKRDRKLRRCYQESDRYRRKCKHKCFILDEIFDCNHLPVNLVHRNCTDNASKASSDEEVRDIYEVESIKQSSSALFIHNNTND